MSDFFPRSPAETVGMGYAHLCTMSKSTKKDIVGSALVIVLTISAILALLLAGAP
jgi:hypothetical protein